MSEFLDNMFYTIKVLSFVYLSWRWNPSPGDIKAGILKTSKKRTKEKTIEWEREVVFFLHLRLLALPLDHSSLGHLVSFTRS